MGPKEGASADATQDWIGGGARKWAGQDGAAAPTSAVGDMGDLGDLRSAARLGPHLARARRRLDHAPPLHPATGPILMAGRVAMVAYLTPGAPGTIVLLNGASCSGKTSIARALQELMEEPWLHVGLD